MIFVILQWHLSGLMNSLCGLPFVLSMLCNWPTLSMSQQGQDSMQQSLYPKWLSQKTIGKRLLIAVFARVFERLAIVGERRAQESLHFPPSLPPSLPSSFSLRQGFSFQTRLSLNSGILLSLPLPLPPIFSSFLKVHLKTRQPLTLFITLRSKYLLCCVTLRTIPFGTSFYLHVPGS